MQHDEQSAKSFLLQLGQHLVAMCGSYVHLNDNGEPVGSPTFYSYTGTVFEILGKWCIATAGHCLIECCGVDDRRARGLPFPAEVIHTSVYMLKDELASACPAAGSLPFPELASVSESSFILGTQFHYS